MRVIRLIQGEQVLVEAKLTAPEYTEDLRAVFHLAANLVLQIAARVTRIEIDLD